MILVLAQPEDLDALWLATLLRRRNEHVEVVLPEELMVGSALMLRISASATTSTMRLHDGRMLDAPRLVVNRLVDVPPLATWNPGEALYLVEEWRATVAAWLRSLHCPVLNPPRATSLAGPALPTAAWRAIARHHGLSVADRDVGANGASRDAVEVITVGCRSLGLPTEAGPIEPALSALARHVGAPLLGVTFDHDGDRWSFDSATPRPALARAGEALVEAVLACAEAGP